MIIDFHAHILPGMDHGCRNVEEMRQQLELADKAAVDYVVATPHFYPHCESVEVFLNRRRQAWDKMLGASKDFKVNILPGAEVLLCEGMERMQGLEKLCIGNTKTILIEMPFKEWEDELLETLDLIHEQGFDIVLAHIERYSKNNIAKIRRTSYAVQVNGEFCGKFAKRKIVSSLIKEDRIAALGSDIHGVGKHYDMFRKAYQYLQKKNCNCMAVSQELLEL